jgi:septal ring factor EnvC (AmiA/AmiB activator)
MKTTRLLPILLPMLLLAFCINCYAQQPAAQMSLLEHQAQRLQSQIEQAKKSNETVMNQQIQGLRNGINNLVQQRVRIDAQIAKLEAQIEDIKGKSQDTLSRQINMYNNDLKKVKAQISSILATKKNPPKSAPAAKVRPAPKRIPGQPVPKK